MTKGRVFQVRDVSGASRLRRRGSDRERGAIGGPITSLTRADPAESGDQVRLMVIKDPAYRDIKAKRMARDVVSEGDGSK